jgi:ligand-binding sensor domain-containing protein
VTCLALDDAGRAWVGTVRGVSVIDAGGTLTDKSDDVWTTFGVDDGLIAQSVNALCVDSGGRMWCATSSGVSVLDTRGTLSDKSDDAWTASRRPMGSVMPYGACWTTQAEPGLRRKEGERPRRCGPFRQVDDA